MSGDNMLNAELISHHILSHCCSWRLQLERCFSSAVVEKLMSSFRLLRTLLLQWLFAYCFSGAADLGWGRVLRTPTSPFALKGECHKFTDRVSTEKSFASLAPVKKRQSYLPVSYTHLTLPTKA